MARKYNVSCYSPPSALKIKSGDHVKVKGWGSGENIRADTITNITENGPICRCGTVVMKVKEKFPKRIDINGKVGKVVQSTDGIEFELTTAK
jgi:hypothetical protein